MSKISVSKKIGKSTIQVIGDSAETMKEILAQGAAIATMPDTCTVCGGEDVTLDSNRTSEGYLYVKVRCLNLKCNSQATAGEYKDGSGIFWKAFEKYVPKEGAASSTKEEKTTVTTKEKEVDDDFSF